MVELSKCRVFRHDSLPRNDQSSVDGPDRARLSRHSASSIASIVLSLGPYAGAIGEPADRATAC